MTGPEEPEYNLSGMSDVRFWQNEDRLLRFLGTQLAEGRLALVLGAGASFGFGLPEWGPLTERLFQVASVPYPEGKKPAAASESLFVNQCGGDNHRFASLLREALYQEFDGSLSTLRTNDLLAGIGSIVTASRRKKQVPVISFNYDGLLERYLRFHAYSVTSVSAFPNWAPTSEVLVFHPHGYVAMPGEPSVRPGYVVYTDVHYDLWEKEELGRWWEPVLLEVLSGHTCLFLGLSGQCRNLSRLLSRARQVHASQEDGEPYWGVRFWAPVPESSPSDSRFTSVDPDSLEEEGSNSAFWEARGVMHWRLSGYDQLPWLLFEIAQGAAGA